MRGRRLAGGPHRGPAPGGDRGPSPCCPAHSGFTRGTVRVWSAPPTRPLRAASITVAGPGGMPADPVVERLFLDEPPPPRSRHWAWRGMPTVGEHLDPPGGGPRWLGSAGKGVRRIDRFERDVGLSPSAPLRQPRATRSCRSCGRRPARRASGRGIRPAEKSTRAVFDGIDAVVNLAGAGIGDRRLTRRRVEIVTESRLGPTALLAASMSGLRRAAVGVRVAVGSRVLR